MVHEVWMVNHYAITPDLPGGTRHYDLATDLAKRGFRIRVFASDVNLALRKRTKLGAGQLYAIEERDGAEFVWVKSLEYRRNDWRRVLNMITFAYNFVKVGSLVACSTRPHIIIGSSPHPFAALAGLWLASKFRCRFFLELRDLWPQALVDLGGLTERHPGVQIMRLIERYLYQHAEKIIILAPGSQKYLEEHGVDAQRVVFLPNGVHFEHFHPSLSRDEARCKYGFDRFTIIYTGAHGPANSLDTILGAAEILKDENLDFVLVGDGPIKEELQQAALEKGLVHVRFLPPVPKSEIPNLLQAADAAVITLKNAKVFSYAVSPNKLFDYMAAGKPVLCSIPGEMAEVVREARAGIVCEPEDPVALAHAICTLYHMEPEDLTHMGLRGREYVAKHFRRELLVDRLVEMFDSDPPRPDTLVPRHGAL